jgi:hypothetical protein
LGLLGLVAVIVLLWLTRALIAGRVAQAYFARHGIESTVEIGALGLSGASARFALGPAAAPDFSADRIELRFDPLRWTPTVVEVRLVHPVVRARIAADGTVSLGSLQGWIDSLRQQQGKSRFVSDDLTVALSGLRALLATPAGALEVDGDVRLVKNLPVSAALTARPARIAWRGTALAVRAASLDFGGDHLVARFTGAAKNAALDAKGVTAALDVTGLRWTAATGHSSIAARQAHLTVAASGLNALDAPRLDMSARNLSVEVGGGISAVADLETSGSARLDAQLNGLRRADPALADAIRRNLARVTLDFAGHAEWRDGNARVALTRPLLLQGGKGGTLRVAPLTLAGGPRALSGAAEISLDGPGLPHAKVTLRNLAWDGQGLASEAALEARFNFAMLRGAEISARGALTWRDGRYAFTPGSCLRVALAAFRPGTSDLARKLHTQLCARGLLLTGEGARWKLSGEARGLSADLPLATAHAQGVAARLDFEGDGAPLRGTASITAATLSDAAASPRFNPLLAGGSATLDRGAWRGKFTLRGGQAKAALGEVTFHHLLATGAGTAHIAAPHIAFAPGKLQPADLSPLLVALRRAEGNAGFTGDINWTHEAITSKGRLSVPALDFMTPLGEAHAVRSDIAFTSLLPPATAPGQHLTIAKVDWTLPLSAVKVDFAENPADLAVDDAAADIAQGHVDLGAFTVHLADPGRMAGVAQLTGIALGDLVTASNLASKIKLTGTVSGRIPFALGPDGFRISNGHAAADGPGRLSVDRSLWAQGDAALSSNAVQDFAYQALENLAFDQLTADLNSVAGGRLQIVFHIKGRSDPPHPQTADVAIADILNGTALYKPIPLPSGTPIDLTLDTSLNFDELLKSYAEAWSKTLSPEGSPETKGVEHKP